MTYFHMGRPHTIIGAIAFHYWVRDGIRWDHNAIVTKQIHVLIAVAINEIRKAVSLSFEYMDVLDVINAGAFYDDTLLSALYSSLSLT